MLAILVNKVGTYVRYIMYPMDLPYTLNQESNFHSEKLFFGDLSTIALVDSTIIVLN